MAKSGDAVAFYPLDDEAPLLGVEPGESVLGVVSGGDGHGTLMLHLNALPPKVARGEATNLLVKLLEDPRGYRNFEWYSVNYQPVVFRPGVRFDEESRPPEPGTCRLREDA